jgi:hypothetical protein
MASWKIKKNGIIWQVLGKLHNERSIDFYSSPNKLRIVKQRRVRWAEKVERM